MITGDLPLSRIRAKVQTTGVNFNIWNDFITGIEITRGGSNFGPYRGGPDPSTCVLTMFVSSQQSTTGRKFPTPGQTFEIQVMTTAGGSTVQGNLFTGVVQDSSIVNVYEPQFNAYGRRVTVYAADQVASIQNKPVNGVVTSTSTKYQTWEQRITTTLVPYFTGSVTGPSTGSTAHIFRLVDNNVSQSLADQLDLACNSVGATWYVDKNNVCQFAAKGVYPKTGILFTDDPTYWNSGNKPANAGSTVYYNMTYNDLEYGSDTASVVNVVEMTNIMPRNMITTAANGTLRYKDPATTPGSSLEVLEATYVAENSTSISLIGRRPRTLTTNVYPYRTSDTESYFVRFNGYNDPGAEYQTTPELFVLGNVCNATTTTSNPKSGTYCWNLTTTALVDGFRVKLGPDGGYPLKVLPTSNTNPYIVSIRVPVATARYTRGIEFYDNNGNILQTQLGTLITPTINVYNTNTTVFMNYTTIPAGTVSWRPIINIAHQTAGTNFAIGTQFKLDEIAVNPDLDTASYFSGDNADTATDLYSWEQSPGSSYSFLSRNVLDDIGTEVISYATGLTETTRYIGWNGIQNYSALLAIEVGARVDVHYNSLNSAAWISQYQISITDQTAVAKLTLSSRPTSWN